MEGTLGFVERETLRGDSREAVLPGGLAKARRPAAGFAQAGSLGGHVKGCASIRQNGLLQPLEPRACDRRCPGHQDRGNQPRCEQSHPGNARGGESRHVPLIKGSSAGRASQEDRPPRKRFSRATSKAPNGAREIPVVLVNRKDCRRRLSMPLNVMRKRAKRARHRGQALWSVNDVVL